MNLHQVTPGFVPNPTMVSPGAVASTSPEQMNVPLVGQIDVTSRLKVLYERALAACNHSLAAAADAMRAVWRWLTAMLARLADALGLRASMAQELTDAQARGEEAAVVDVQGNPGADPRQNELAAETLQQEADRMLAYLQEHPVVPGALSDPATASEFVRLHAKRLGTYRAVFKERARSLEGAVQERCVALARVEGTTPEVIRQQISADADGGLYDRDGTLRGLLTKLAEAKLAMNRCELLAIAFVEAASHPKSLAGMREHALSELSNWMPEVPFERAAPPRGEVAQSSGETSAVGEADLSGNTASERPVRQDDQRPLDAANDAFAAEPPLHNSQARDTVRAKNILESGPLQTTGQSPENAGDQGLVQSASQSQSSKSASDLVSPSAVVDDSQSISVPVDHQDRAEAMASAFAGSGFAGLLRRPGSRFSDEEQSRHEIPTPKNGG